MEKNKSKAFMEGKMYYPQGKSNKSNFNIVYTNRKNNKQSLAPKTNLQISKDAYYY
jgi:hypothetical protein